MKKKNLDQLRSRMNDLKKRLKTANPEASRLLLNKAKSLRSQIKEAEREYRKMYHSPRSPQK